MLSLGFLYHSDFLALGLSQSYSEGFFHVGFAFSSMGKETIFPANKAEF